MMRTMPPTSKKNITSQSTLRTIKLKLQGRCDYCSGKLPEHKGVCPVYGKELQDRYDGIDMEVKHISTIIDNIVAEYKNV